MQLSPGGRAAPMDRLNVPETHAWLGAGTLVTLFIPNPTPMSSLPPIAESLSLGGRAGSVKTSRKGFNLHFKPPTKSNSQGLTPEHLFGAAWAACFNGAVTYIAKASGFADKGITVKAHVQLQPEGPKPFVVKLLVSIPGLEAKKAQQVLKKAHAMCAYSRATKGNVDVTIALE
jgi:Ohr subfamily peroxiredoxin